MTRVHRAWDKGLRAFAGSIWAVADQGIVSAGSLGFNLVLARTVSERDFGTLVLAVGGLYLLQTVHRAFILYPLSLRVAASRGEHLQHWALSSSVLSLPLSSLLGLIAGAAALLMSQPPHVAAMLAAAVIATQSHEVLRWVHLARLQHRCALVADAVRHGSAVAGVLILFRLGHAGIPGAFGCLAGGAILGVVWQLWRLRLWVGSADRVRLLAHDAWRLGRWDFLGGSISNFSSQLMPWALAGWHGVDETGRLQAVASLLGATHPVIFGLGNLVSPAVAEAAESSRAHARAVGVRYGLIGSLVLIPYLAVLLLLPGTTLMAVYGRSSPYASQTAPLRWFVITYVFVYVLQTAQAILNGLGRSRDVSFISFAGLSLQAVIVLPLAIKGGLLASCIGLCVSHVIHTIVALRFLNRASVPSPAAENTTVASIAGGGQDRGVLGSGAGEDIAG
jgi:O-antigen/teichoic acid export membrane protein